MLKKLSFSLLLITITSLADSAEIVCKWNGNECNILSITPVTQRNEAITIAGKPGDYGNSETLDVSFHRLGATLNYVPTNIFYIFPRAFWFTMSSASAKTILETSSFVSCENLSNILFLNINILNVPEGFAQACFKVQLVSFQNAGIDTIHQNAFKGLTKLRSLSLNNNRITCLPPDLFQTIPNVEYIDLQRNRISAIDSKLFKNLPNVIQILMSFNSISYLPTLDFTGSTLYSQININLSQNPINAIQPDFCNSFSPRPNVAFIVTQIKCLLGEDTEGVIRKPNCQSSMAVPLQKCYSNWASTMNVPVKCGIPWNSIWQQILDSLKK